MCLYVSMWIDSKIKCISYYTNTTLIKCVFLSLQKLWHLQNTGGGLYFYMKSFLGSLSLIKILALNIFSFLNYFTFEKMCIIWKYGSSLKGCITLFWLSSLLCFLIWFSSFLPLNPPLNLFCCLTKCNHSDFCISKYPIFQTNV